MKYVEVRGMGSMSMHNEALNGVGVGIILG